MLHLIAALKADCSKLLKKSTNDVKESITSHVDELEGEVKRVTTAIEGAVAALEKGDAAGALALLKGTQTKTAAA
jgi:hypothetical protein